jgi:DNA gyrase/topoisomerase IV subunit A
MVKKTPVKELPGSSSQVLQAMKVAPEDSVGWAFVLSGKDDILLVTSIGMSIRFREEEVRPTGWGTVGVMGIRLSRPDELVTVTAIPKTKEEVILAAANGLAKRVPVSQYPVQGRNGVGVSTWKIAGKSQIIGGFSGTADDRMFLVSKDGQSRVLLAGEVPKRTRQGAGKNILPRKEKGLLEMVVPARMKGPAAKPRKQPARAGKHTAKKKKRGKK